MAGDLTQAQIMHRHTFLRLDATPRRSLHNPPLIDIWRRETLFVTVSLSRFWQ